MSSITISIIVILGNIIAGLLIFVVYKYCGSVTSPQCKKCKSLETVCIDRKEIIGHAASKNSICIITRRYICAACRYEFDIAERPLLSVPPSELFSYEDQQIKINRQKYGLDLK